MRMTSDRWQILSAAILLVGFLYFAAEDFSRHSTRDLAWGSITLWNIFVIALSYLWWWPRRRAFQAAIKKPSRQSRILMLSSILASALASVVLVMVGVGLLEQGDLGLQVMGVLLLVIASLLVPGWTLWFYLRAGRAGRASSLDPGTGG